MLRVLQLNLFDRRPLVELFTTPSPPGSPTSPDAAVVLKMWDSSDWHLTQIYQKQSISRQVDLVRLVLSLAELG